MLDVGPAGDQHARRVRRCRTDGARAGRRARRAGQAHQRAVGHGVAPGQPADPRHPRAAGALPDPRYTRRPPRRRRDLRGQRRLGLLRGRAPPRRPTATAATSSTARSGSSPSATSPTSSSCWPTCEPEQRRNDLPDRRRHPGCEDQARPALHAHLRLRAPRVHLRGRPRRGPTPCSAASARATT